MIFDGLCFVAELFENNYWITFDKIGDYSFDIEFWYAIKKWYPSVFFGIL